MIKVHDVVCDKCGSDDVYHKELSKPPSYIKMSEYVKKIKERSEKSGVSYGMYMPEERCLRCAYCGHEVKYEVAVYS